MPHTPRILLWDVENTHNVVAVFQLKNNDYIQSDNILQERHLISAAWKWLGESKVHAISLLDNPQFKKHPHDDGVIVRRLHELLQEADVIVAHNGDEFDTKIVQGRMLIHGLPPLPPIPSIDTLKVARSRFLLNANNLDYLGQLLHCGRKKSTPKGLWLKVLQGDATAIRQMVKYNKGDIVLLEKVFKRLQPYMSSHIHRQLFGGGGECPRCGSMNVQSRGLHRATTNTYQRYQCQTCSGWFREKKANKSVIHTRIL